MKKYVSYIIITILLVVIASGTTYMLMKDNNKTDIKENDNKTNNNEESNNQNKEPLKEDGVKLVKTYNSSDKIIEEFEIILNGKTKNMNIIFERNKSISEDGEEILDKIDIYGKFQNEELVRAYTLTKENSFNINNIKKMFNEDNFKLIKGKDNKNYLAIIPYESGYSYHDIDLYIFNEELSQIKGNFDSYGGPCSKEDNMTIVTLGTVWFLENNLEPWYQNSFNNQSNKLNEKDAKISVKLENDKIYYLAPVLKENFEENDYGILEEREYTINNNKLEYKVVNSYKIVDGAGQVC